MTTVSHRRWRSATRLESPLSTVRRFKSDPVGTQERLLRDLLTRATHTEWGRRFGFGELARAADAVRIYQNRVPLHGYDAYQKDVRRVRYGEEDVFWPGGFRHFAVSSGTASDGTIIPVSVEMLEKDRRFSLAVAQSYIRATHDPRFLFGRFLSIPGRIDEDEGNPGVMIGEVSGLLALFSPWYIKRFYEAVSHDILFLPHWDHKLDAIIDATVSMDIRAIAMVPSWAIVLFPRLIDRYNHRYSMRARTVNEIWPNLQVFFSGGVALSSYHDLLEHQIGKVDMHFIESYGASEGFVSFQEHPNDKDMLVHLDNGVFLEFVGVEENSETPSRLTIADVETGIRYQIYVTTCSGLWSYAVGDVVRFTCLNPHKIVVSGRTNEMIDVYGEAVYGDETREALERACRVTGASVRDYHVAPVEASADRLPGHQWLIEFETPPPDYEEFSVEIDRYLQEVNRHYVIRREAEAFAIPEIIALPKGTFYDWLKKNRRTVSAQTKVPRMRDDRRIAEDVLRISGNNT